MTSDSSKPASKTKAEIIRFWKEVTPSAASEPVPIKLPVVDQIANYFSPGSYFYYVFDFALYEMRTVSENIVDILGIQPEAFTPTEFLNCVHPDDIELLQQKELCAGKFIFEHIPPEKITNYKVSYTIRLIGKDGKVFNNLHQSTAIKLTSTGSLGPVFCTETDVSHLTTNMHETISFIDLTGEKSYLNIDVTDFQLDKQQSGHNLSNQELKVIQKISQGLSNEEISVALNISPHTVRTHRQNILKKYDHAKMPAIVSDLLRRGYI